VNFTFDSLLICPFLSIPLNSNFKFLAHSWGIEEDLEQKQKQKQKIPGLTRQAKELQENGKI